MTTMVLPTIYQFENINSKKFFKIIINNNIEVL